MNTAPQKLNALLCTPALYPLHHDLNRRTPRVLLRGAAILEDHWLYVAASRKDVRWAVKFGLHLPQALCQEADSWPVFDPGGDTRLFLSDASQRDIAARHIPMRLPDAATRKTRMAWALPPDALPSASQWIDDAGQLITLRHVVKDGRNAVHLCGAGLNLWLGAARFDRLQRLLTHGAARDDRPVQSVRDLKPSGTWTHLLVASHGHLEISSETAPEPRRYALSPSAAREIRTRNMLLSRPEPG